MKYLILLIFLTGCTVEISDVYGEYVKEDGDVNELLHLKSNYTYERKIYHNDTILLEFNGKWSFDDDAVWLEDFFRSFSTAKLYKNYIHLKSKDDRLDNVRLNIQKSLGSIYIEETESGKVFSTYVK